MAQQIISLGTVANDGTGDTIRLGGQKINANFTELYTTKLDSVGAGTNVSIDNTDPINPIINVTGLTTVIDNQTSSSTTSALSANQGRLLRIRDETIGKLFTHGLPQIEIQGYLFPVDLSGVNQDGSDDIISLEDFGGDPGDPHYILISKTGPFDYLNYVCQFPGNVLRIILYEDYYAETIRYARTFNTTPIDIAGLDPNYYCFEVIEDSGLDHFGANSYTGLFGAVNCVGVDVSSTYTFTNGLTESSGTVSLWNATGFPGFSEVTIPDGNNIIFGSFIGQYGLSIAVDGVNTIVGLSGAQVNLVSDDINIQGGDVAITGDDFHFTGSGTVMDMGTIGFDLRTSTGQSAYLHGADSLTIASDDELIILTPAVQAETASNGQVLTLINSTTGEVEYTGGQIEESASFTLDDTYLNKVVIITNGASNINITVDTSLSNGFKCGFIQYGTGTVTFVASGTTLRSANGLIIDGQYNQAFIEKRNAGTNELFVLGNLTT